MSEMSKFKLLLKGSALRTTESIVAILAGFITLPLMLHHLGDELYGFWVLASGFTGLMYIFDLGFASAVTRNVTHAISTHDNTKANQVINSSLVIYVGLSLLIVLVVGSASVFYEPDLTGVITEQDFSLVLFILGLSIALEFPVKAFSGVATAHYRFDLLSIYRIAIKIVSSGALIALLLMGYSVVAIAASGLIIGIVSNFLFFLLAKYIYRDMRLSRQYVDRQTSKELFSYSSWAFLIDLNQMLKQRIDLFFIGGFISLSAVSVYFIPVRLVEYSSQLLYKMLNIALPVLTDHSANEDKENFREDLIIFNRMNTYCAAIAISGFIVLGEPILFYWMGTNFDYLSAYHILIVLLIGRLSSLSANAFTTGLYAEGKLRLVAKISFMETCLATILLAIGLGLYRLGPVYAAYAVASPLILGRLLLLPRLSGTHMKIERLNRLLIVSFRPLLLVPLVYLLDLAINSNVPEINWRMAATSAAALIAGLTFIYIEVTARERALFRRLTPRILSKAKPVNLSR